MDGRHSDAGRTSLQSAYHNKKDVQLRFLLIRLKPRKFQNDVQMNTAVDAFACCVYIKAWVYPFHFRMERVRPVLQIYMQVWRRFSVASFP